MQKMRYLETEMGKNADPVARINVSGSKVCS